MVKAKRNARISCFAQNTINIKLTNYDTARTLPQTSLPYLEVPKRKQRYNLIQHEHFMGHYQTPAVLAALSPTNY
jgi:hypothetical protein